MGGWAGLVAGESCRDTRDGTRKTSPRAAGEGKGPRGCHGVLGCRYVCQMPEAKEEVGVRERTTRLRKRE